MSYVNADGLLVLTNTAEGTPREQGITTEGAKKYFVLDIEDMTAVPVSAAAPQQNDAYIPAGSFITGAFIIVDTACTSGGSATLNVGLQTRAGVAIDADGIDATVAVADLAANKAVVCNGALVGGTATIGAENGYISFDYDTAAFTAGALKIVIEYIAVDAGKDAD
jgi:hypothetical protein|tara:strand:- start:1778 stop:2275 length:498 start_codon:yes stop_codon:yes gene_type:complete